MCTVVWLLVLTHVSLFLCFVRVPFLFPGTFDNEAAVFFLSLREREKERERERDSERERESSAGSLSISWLLLTVGHACVCKIGSWFIFVRIFVGSVRFLPTSLSSERHGYPWVELRCQSIGTFRSTGFNRGPAEHILIRRLLD